jgi:tripartite-type tricarboxylate transporter receptor subunit TctC
MNRKQFYYKSFLSMVMVTCLMMSIAHAQSWPTKTIKVVVPFGPGGANDLVARAVAEGLTKELGQSVVVENKPGAGAVLGADFVAKSAPDGYTFLAPAAGIVTNSLIKTKMPYKESDLVPIAMLAVSPSIIVVASDSPYKDLKSLVEDSKKGQGLHFSTAGTGSTPHIVAEMLKIETGAKFDIIPYKSGSEGMVAVVGHQTDLTSEASVVTIPQIKGGKLRPLASTWSSRISVLADVPTMKELGYPQILIGHWSGMFAPTGTSPEILEKMNLAINHVLKQPEIRNRLIAQGIEPIGGTRESFQKYLKEERDRLAKVVKTSNMSED